MLTILTVLASLSPLLTFAHLLQMKEWRWDRLREHVRGEGLRQVFGTSRPIVVATMLAWLLVTGYWLLVPSTLGILTALNIVQLFLKKQPYPVWTRKAITLIGTSLLITTGTSYWLLVTGYWFPVVLLPLLQPAFLLAAWTLWKPVDHILKCHILTKAKNLRTQFPNLTVIGVTGSAGKTTTKELLAHILGPERALATPEHINSELGVAQWVLRKFGENRTCHPELVEGSTCPHADVMVRRAHHDTSAHPSILIVEMGAYRQGEIATICGVVRPTMGIITNIGTQHIGLFGSQRAIVEAKGELFAALPLSGHAFVSVDTPFTQELRQKCQCPVTTVGTEGTPADVRATHVEEMPEGLRFHLTRANEPTHSTSSGQASQRANFTIPLHGEHQLGSALLAIAAAMECGVPLEEIAQRLRTFQPPKHTFSVREDGGITILDDTHNASPESLRAAIEWARHQPHKPKILITPGIIEQGLSSARVHFQCGSLAKDIFDEVFILNKKFAHHFAQGFCQPVHHLPPKTYNLTPGALIACVGRLPQSTIQKFLP